MITNILKINIVIIYDEKKSFYTPIKNEILAILSPMQTMITIFKDLNYLMLCFIRFY